MPGSKKICSSSIMLIRSWRRKKQHWRMSILLPIRKWYSAKNRNLNRLPKRIFRRPIFSTLPSRSNNKTNPWLKFSVANIPKLYSNWVAPFWKNLIASCQSQFKISNSDRNSSIKAEILKSTSLQIAITTTTFWPQSFRRISTPCSTNFDPNKKAKLKTKTSTSTKFNSSITQSKTARRSLKT